MYWQPFLKAVKPNKQNKIPWSWRKPIIDPGHCFRWSALLFLHPSKNWHLCVAGRLLSCRNRMALLSKCFADLSHHRVRKEDNQPYSSFYFLHKDFFSWVETPRTAYQCLSTGVLFFFFFSKMTNLSVTYFNTFRQMASEKEALIKNNLFSLLMIYYNTNFYLCLQMKLIWRAQKNQFLPPGCLM